MVKLSDSEFRGCVEVEVAVLGSPSLISLMVSVDVKYHERRKSCVKVEVIVLGSPSLISQMVYMETEHWTSTYGSQSSGSVWKLRWPSLICLMVSVDVQQHWTSTCGSQSSGTVWKLRWLSLISLMVSMHVKEHERRSFQINLPRSHQQTFFALFVFVTPFARKPPWYNRTDWLGVKHQLTYLLACS